MCTGFIVTRENEFVREWLDGDDDGEAAAGDTVINILF